jgi:hypothetical protein
MSPADGPDGLDAVLRGEAVSWSALGSTASGLLETCAVREITGIVHEQLIRRRHAHDWPGEVCSRLASAAHAAAARELVRGREIGSVLDALAARAVQPILLKGVALAYAFYASPASRPRLDTDLLIRRDEVQTIRQTMAALGYTEPPFGDGELLFAQFQMVKQDRFGVDHIFDFHWKISTQSMFADVLAYDDLAAASEPVPALGSHARAANRVHALLLACIHPVMHHRNVERLVWLYDIHLLVSRLSDTELHDFAALADDRRVAAICARQLALTRARFHTPVPAPLMAGLASPRAPEPTGIYLRPARRWHHELVSNIRGLEGWADRLRLLREIVLPGPRYMMEAYSLPASGFVLLPAVYVHRCVYGVWKILRGRK